MPVSSKKRPPTLHDILLVLEQFHRHQVEYILIGGAAMAFHGFPRMTKDIDCLFPTDRENNARLMAAITDIAKQIPMEYLPQLEWLDQGFSTAAEGELGIDILYVAASRNFADYQAYIEERVIQGVTVKVLNIDGMLMSKETGREEDIPDRNRLRKLKTL